MLWNVGRSGQDCVGESEDEKLVVVGDQVTGGVGDGLEKIVVVGDPEGVDPRFPLLQILAEPNLIALSGDTASFLAGGEFPVPVAQGTNGAVTVQFQSFGVGLAFTPTVTGDDVINLAVAPEVSQLDKENSVRITPGSDPVPALTVRRAKTTIELRDGQSFAIAGLLQNTYQNAISQFPWVGDVPAPLRTTLTNIANGDFAARSVAFSPAGGWVVLYGPMGL